MIHTCGSYVRGMCEKRCKSLMSTVKNDEAWFPLGGRLEPKNCSIWAQRDLGPMTWSTNNWTFHLFGLASLTLFQLPTAFTLDEGSWNIILRGCSNRQVVFQQTNMCSISTWGSGFIIFHNGLKIIFISTVNNSETIKSNILSTHP